jgi:hypothetical protein
LPGPTNCESPFAVQGSATAAAPRWRAARRRSPAAGVRMRMAAVGSSLPAVLADDALWNVCCAPLRACCSAGCSAGCSVGGASLGCSCGAGCAAGRAAGGAEPATVPAEACAVCVTSCARGQRQAWSRPLLEAARLGSSLSRPQRPPGPDCWRSALHPRATGAGGRTTVGVVNARLPPSMPPGVRNAAYVLPVECAVADPPPCAHSGRYANRPAWRSACICSSSLRARESTARRFILCRISWEAAQVARKQPARQVGRPNASRLGTAERLRRRAGGAPGRLRRLAQALADDRQRALRAASQVLQRGPLVVQPRVLLANVLALQRLERVASIVLAAEPTRAGKQAGRQAVGGGGV